MSDMLKMRTADFEKLTEMVKNKELHSADLREWEHAALIDLLPEGWSEQSTVWFNENFEYGDVQFQWLSEILVEFKMPYEFFSDGDIESDDYWEYYNPTVCEEPQTANYSKEFNAYLFKEWNFKDLVHLPGDAFKMAVQAFFENPFAKYPKLETIVD